MNRSKVLGLLCGSISIIILSLAQGEQLVQPKIKTPSRLKTIPAAKKKPLKKSKPTLQLWNLQQADIRGVVRVISELTGKNFIIDPSVHGKITVISARPMSIDEIYQVFLSMLQVLNYSAVPVGDVIKIIPTSQIRGYGGNLATTAHPGIGDEVVVRVVSLSNVSATQIVPVLRPLVDSWGSITAYTPSNTLILAGSAANVNRVISIVNRLDKKNARNIQVIHLKYANAQKIVKVIRSILLSDQAKGRMRRVSIEADEENNAILISGNKKGRAEFAHLIQKLDTADSNGGTRTVVIHLNYLDAKKISPILAKIAEGKLEQKNNRRLVHHYGVNNNRSSISVQAEEDDNALIISAPGAVVESLKNVVRQLDVRPRQVLVQAIIVRVDESVVKQLGVQWGTTNPDGGNAISVASFPAGIGFIPHGSLRILIQALMTHSSTDILATPSVLVLNNKSAVISDGKNVGITNRQYEGTGSAASDNSTLPFNTIEREDVTLQLKVKPQITPGNTVRLEIDQQNNSLDPDSTSTPDNPTIDTSKIKTSVLVDSGDILVLGGLISNDNKESLNKVPILGSIPIIGRLFQYKNHHVERKNLMVFIRPVIINNKKQSQEETLDRYDYMRDQELLKRAGIDINIGGRPLLPERDESPHLVDLPPPF